MTERLLRKEIINSAYIAKACHIGSALSCVEIVEAIMEYKGGKDIFIFAKASGVLTLYCYLYGELAAEKIAKYPLPSKEAGLIWSGGSLGMGLSVAVGLALADRDKKVYCLISDGELQEGQTWEAIMFAGHHKLNNLILVVDRNHLQSIGNTEDIVSLEPIKDKFIAFNWRCTKCDGHNKESIKQGFNFRDINNRDNLPLCLIAETIKGKGVDFMEDSYEWHYRNLDEERFKEAILQVTS